MDIILKIAGIGIVVMIIDKVLESAGKKEIASIITIAGLVTVFVLMVGMVAKLLTNVQSIFGF